MVWVGNDMTPWLQSAGFKHCDTKVCDGRNPSITTSLKRNGNKLTPWTGDSPHDFLDASTVQHVQPVQLVQEPHYWRSHCGSFWAIKPASDISTSLVQSLVVTDLRWDVFLLTSQSSWGAEGAALTKILAGMFSISKCPSCPSFFGSCRFWQNLFRNKKYHPFLYWGLALFWKPTNFPLRQRYYLENLHIPKNNQWSVQIFLVKWSHFFRGDLPY